MNWLWVGNHVPVSECQCHHILSCHLGFKFIAICDPWCWYIYLHGWVILFGPMLVNILYMEHMGYDSGWETRRKTATQGQPGKQRGNTIENKIGENIGTSAKQQTWERSKDLRKVGCGKRLGTELVKPEKTYGRYWKMVEFADLYRATPSGASCSVQNEITLWLFNMAKMANW